MRSRPVGASSSSLIRVWLVETPGEVRRSSCGAPNEEVAKRVAARARSEAGKSILSLGGYEGA